MHRNSEQTPTSAGDPRVATLVSWLPESAVETWEERAAIRQFDAGYTKRDAEIEALLDVLVGLGPQWAGLAIAPSVPPGHAER